MGTYRTITIATTTGALAEETGRLLAQRLGRRHVNEQILDLAAQRAGVSREAVDEVEHSQPLVARVLQALTAASAQEALAWTPEAAPYVDASPVYRALIRDTIEGVAAEGDAVIVAHGAGILLAGRPGVLRVLVTASPAVRAARIAAERGCSAREAARIVRHTDGERAAYLRRFSGVRREQPSDYDLVVNTDALSPAAAAGIVAYAAEQRAIRPPEADLRPEADKLSNG